jgi:hypothetical protein
MNDKNAGDVYVIAVHLEEVGGQGGCEDGAVVASQHPDEEVIVRQDQASRRRSQHLYIISHFSLGKSLMMATGT